MTLEEIAKMLEEIRFDLSNIRVALAKVERELEAKGNEND